MPQIIAEILKYAVNNQENFFSAFLKSKTQHEILCIYSDKFNQLRTSYLMTVQTHSHPECGKSQEFKHETSGFLFCGRRFL